MNQTLIPENSRGTMQVRGKFLFEGDQKFYVRGVTYGTFQPQADGAQFPSAELVEMDFRLMAEKGFNSVRTYTAPPLHLLDIAHKYGLKVMVGLPWEQHLTFLEDPRTKTGIFKRIKEAVSAIKGHPAILCYTIGNEIPATIVRWYGKKRIEHFLKSLYKRVKSVDPDTLVTYVNYPTTEYLDLSFLDFDCFNVYLETPEKLGRYISRLHNLSGDRPLVLAEIGLDSQRNGEAKQAEVLKWQVATIFEKGCAGMFVFAWTDEWWRGGFEIEDWDFGLVDRQRKSKPALAEVKAAMEEIPVRKNDSLPLISVVVCSYNGSVTIRECLTGILKLEYPSFEVIVVNDGSKDNLASIVSEFPVKLISTPNRGLSNARNTGLYNSSGEIVAYIDDDAFPDPHWLQYLAYAYQNSNHACIGGPNIAPGDDGFIATCVANAPGGPVHVLLSDEVAEHVPGCNMTFRKEALTKIGGFDPIYRNAGDDVDVCWRIQESGHTVGFHPAALVWHRRRNSFKAYWRQQKGYGKAEALLEAKWPEKYNAFGHVSWAGRIYGNGFTLPVKVKKDKIFHGTWGTALFQSVYAPAEGFWSSLPLMPEWYLFSLFLALLGGLGFLWTPLLWAWVVFGASILIVIAQAIRSASKNVSLTQAQKKNPKYRIYIAWLHLIQPIARLYGRFVHGLTPWRKRGADVKPGFLLPVGRKTFTHWSETWKASETWLTHIEEQLKTIKARVRKGGQFDNWDLQLRSGLFMRSKGLLAIEEHGAGKQFLKFRCRPGYSMLLIASIALSVVAGVLGLVFNYDIVAIVSGSFLLFLVIASMVAQARCISSFSVAFEALSLEQEEILKIVRKERMILSEISPGGQSRPNGNGSLHYDQKSARELITGKGEFSE